MDRLSIILTLMTGAVLTGGLVIAAFSLGWYGWPSVIVSVVIGFGASWPTGYLISRRIKRQDPGWDETRVDRVEKGVPDPNAREV